MKAVVFDAINQVDVREVPYPKLKSDEIIIKVMAAGLCGSDVHIFKGGYPANYPLIPGHEFSGIVHEVGSEVTEWKIGDRVTADPNKYCGHCYYCLSDQGNMCENATASGVTRDGGFAQYVAVPGTNVFKLPDEVSFEDGAFIEPLSCSVYAMKRLNVRYGDRALVFGAGPMGLLMLMNLMTGGASEVVCMDMEKERVKAALEIGAFRAFDTLKDLEGYVADARKFDVVVDATGNPNVIESMFSYAAKRAKILQFGCANSQAIVRISPFEIYNNDWEYIGTRANCYTFNQAINLMKTKAVTSKKIINDFISLDQVPDYINGIRPKGSLKVIIRPNL
jgi:2-desacetyl-2-hydroxyethyl bacteriochlorophyllide A dehydrogenase